MSLDSVTEYALTFSGDAVHLQKRDPFTPSRPHERKPAWRHLGSVDFDEPDFHDMLTELRTMATGEGAEVPLAVTLVIPDDQILYTTLTIAPSGDRERAVAKSLDGLTPYPIDELSFDWEGEGDSVRVAAVARQTLREALEFAREYGFEGQRFSADPEHDQFVGEPDFALAAPGRQRPVIDPAQAGVTAAALMFSDDVEVAKDDPTQDEFVPQAAEDAPDEALQDAAEAAGDAPLAEAADDLDTVPPDSPAEDEEPAGHPSGTASDAGSVAETSFQPLPPLAERDEQDPDTAFEDAERPDMSPEAAAILRHPPQSEAAPADPLNPRARAVHQRAAEARQNRVPGAAPSAPVRPASARTSMRRHSGLFVMLAVLVVGLAIAWAFLAQDKPVAQIAPDPTPVQVAAVDLPAADAPVVEDPNAADPTAEDPVEEYQASDEAVTDPAAQALSAEDPAAEMPAADAAQAVSPTTDLSAAPATLREDTAAASVTADSTVTEPEALPPLMLHEMSDRDARRVVVAAAAVAAAVVPPPAAAPAETTAAVSDPVPAVADTPSAPTPEAATAQPAPAKPAATVPAVKPAAVQPPASSQTRSAAPAPTRSTVGTGRPASANRKVAAPAPAQAASEADAPAAAKPQLSSSARPQLSPRRSTPQTSTPRMDTAPRVPSDPLPYAASQKSTRPTASARPPVRSSAPAHTREKVSSAADTREIPVTAPTHRARPPQRPEGSVPEIIQPETDAQLLDDADRLQLDALVQDLRRHGLALPQPTVTRPAVRLAEARPLRKPKDAKTVTDAVSPSAVEDALRSATAAPPERPAKAATKASGKTARAADTAPDQTTAAAPASLRGSMRPAARPGGTHRISEEAVEKAIAAAVDASPAIPNAIKLSALNSSPLPPRRTEDGPARAADDDKPDTPAAAGAGAAAVAAAAAPGPDEAELAARRALDEQLQSQAEARIRARAQADAAAEAQARAQAEARARAQAAAEERTARARQQQYKPPEVDDEPEIASNAARGGATTASVAKAATQSRALDTGRTTIIGIIGAGNASRALIRLRNGKVVTVRLGDKIDGGTINSIGDGRLTYVKAGRVRELRMLDGR
ncbi:hypothetical protein RM190_07785 [Paracoccus sp. CPCC 101403]|uniref:Meckel syndrome type 1 protein n=1 Tax=Paracoccus broussonetiae TaxID=3075834 RepID=A0ABU3EC01_9RHOB|nr:hypothetical protein [Paracoccus sp. CPCC 101403]MDT1061755.1 hypothetical protein [Paracoccus sp. CPCC 101403]